MILHIDYLAAARRRFQMRRPGVAASLLHGFSFFRTSHSLSWTMNLKIQDIKS